MFLGKAVLKICSKFTGEHPCRRAISIKLQSNANFSVNLLHVFLTHFPKTPGRLLLDVKFENVEAKFENVDPGIKSIFFCPTDRHMNKFH